MSREQQPLLGLRRRRPQPGNLAKGVAKAEVVNQQMHAAIGHIMLVTPLMFGLITFTSLFKLQNGQGPANPAEAPWQNLATIGAITLWSAAGLVKSIYRLCTQPNISFAHLNSKEIATINDIVSRFEVMSTQLATQNKFILEDLEWLNNNSDHEEFDARMECLKKKIKYHKQANAQKAKKIINEIADLLQIDSSMLRPSLLALFAAVDKGDSIPRSVWESFKSFMGTAGGPFVAYLVYVYMIYTAPPLALTASVLSLAGISGIISSANTWIKSRHSNKQAAYELEVLEARIGTMHAKLSQVNLGGEARGEDGFSRARKIFLNLDNYFQENPESYPAVKEWLANYNQLDTLKDSAANPGTANLVGMLGLVSNMTELNKDELPVPLDRQGSGTSINDDDDEFDLGAQV